MRDNPAIPAVAVLRTASRNFRFDDAADMLPLGLGVRCGGPGRTRTPAGNDLRAPRLVHIAKGYHCFATNLDEA
jgi:hypothetical protein